jgi:hypothetical protein
MRERWRSPIIVSWLVATVLGATACPGATSPDAPSQTTNPGDWCGTEPCSKGTPPAPPEPHPSEAPTVPGPGVSAAP